MRKMSPSTNVTAPVTDEVAGSVLTGTARTRATLSVSSPAPRPSEWLWAALGTAEAGIIRSLDLTAVRQSPEVVSAVTLADLPRPKPGRNGMVLLTHRLLAADRIDYPGQPLFAVVARTSSAARDAVALAQIEYADPLPSGRTSGHTTSQTSGTQTAALSQPALRQPAPKGSEITVSDQSLRPGDELEGTIRISGASSPGQPRVCRAYPDNAGRLIIEVPYQHSPGLAPQIGRFLGMPSADIKVLTSETPGAPSNVLLSREASSGYACIAAWLALHTGQPVCLPLAPATRKDHSGVAVRYRVRHTSDGRIVRWWTDASQRHAWIALEQAMDHVAQRIGSDPLDVRRINLDQLSSYGAIAAAPLITDTPWDHLNESLVEALVKRAEYDKRRGEVMRFNTRSATLKRGLSIAPVIFDVPLNPGDASDRLPQASMTLIGLACSEVILDRRSGEYRLLRMDVLVDTPAFADPVAERVQHNMEESLLGGLEWLRVQSGDPQSQSPELRIELRRGNFHRETIHELESWTELGPNVMATTCVWSALGNALQTTGAKNPQSLPIPTPFSALVTSQPAVDLAR